MSLKPALTAEEWKADYATRFDKGSDRGVFSDGSISDRKWTVLRGAGQVFVSVDGEGGQPCMIGLAPTVNHPMAALCLHEQPFGFTRWMVQWMTSRSLRAVPQEVLEKIRTKADIDKIIADRIEALLPPEDI